MTALDAALRRRIAEQGPITLADYMAACLTDPAHGYYRRGDPLGEAGDFTTAPEISQMFGELLGLWAAETWQQMGAPNKVRLIELGPGRGTLMADALRAVRQAAPAFAAALDLHLVEINPSLRARQRQALGDTPASWHERIDSLPPGPALIVANEFFDALPIRQFVREADGWHERMVGLAGDRLAYVSGPPVAEPPIEPAHADAPVGAIAEIGAVAQSVVATLVARLCASGGVLLLIDYGPARSAPGDSLQALRRHQKVDPLAAPGDSDLTAHVDFAALARVARASEAVAFGPVAQGVFLNRLGIVARAAMLARRATAAQARDIEAACRRLIGDSEMGTLFKVLAIAGPDAPAPPGFDP
jgi:NADH dehydrogenase [ubiquinone] 1 alpha subcomplex assembly factor 7